MGQTNMEIFLRILMKKLIPLNPPLQKGGVIKKEKENGTSFSC